jgi:HSP20 family protein
MEKDPQHSQAPTTKGVPVVEDTRAVAAALVVVEDTADRAALVVHGAMAAHTMEDLTMDLMVITKDHIMDAVTDPLMALLEGPVVLVVGAVGAHGDAEDSLEAVVASALATHFWNQFNESLPSNADNNKATTNSEDHTPDADVFDTESAFVVHVSLPGAKKEDVGVNWDAEKSELSIAGVIYRPGDEEFLKSLAMSERKVGAFERKIRLGTRATPAHIDADGITAKLEDGILRVEVPKLDTGYVEIKKVDIE